MPGAQSKPKANPLTVLLILWAAMMSTQAIFVIIARTATLGGQASVAPAVASDAAAAPGVYGLPVPMFAGLAVISVLMAVFLPKLLVKAQVSKLGQTGERVSLEKLAPIATTMMIVRWALLESVTLYGLILSLTNADPNLILPFAAVALIGFALTFPSESGMRKALGVN